MRTLLATAALTLAFASGASAAVPFGANIEAAPSTASFLCSGPVPPFGAFSGVPTCTAYSAGVFGSGAGSHLVPSGFGVITRVDIRMPNATGPMQITVLRSLRQAQSTTAVCCYWVAESQAFTPAAGQISSIPVQLPVKSELTQTNVFEYDAIAITTLAAGTPVPAAPVSGGSSGGYFPGVTRGQERFEQQASLGETQIMLRGIWEPDADRDGLGDESQDRCVGGRRRAVAVAVAAQCSTGSPPPAPPPGSGAPPAPSSTPGPAAPVVTIGRRRSGSVSGGRAAVRLSCGAVAPCAGSVLLQNKAASAAPRKTFGSATFSIAAGATRAVRVRLNAAGRRLLRRTRRPRVWVNIPGPPAVSVRIALRR